MKQELQIIGADVTGLDQVKITCIPYTTPEVRKKKKSLMDMATGGINVQELIQEAKETQQEKTVFYVTVQEWREFFKNQLLSRIVVDINVEEVI